MGGSQEGFLTTQWSWIMGMGTSDSQRHKAILDQIVQRYWKPVYCYLRRKGFSNERAKDLTQAFFCDIVLDTDLIRRADKTKGRFRTFLLTALECYVVDEHRSQSARCRSPKGTLVSLDDDSVPELPAAAAGLDPSAMFSYVWATQILDDALLEVERQCLASRKEIHWKVFRDKVLQPIRDGQPGPPLNDLCRRYSIATERAASNMIITVKRCFQRVLEELLRREADHTTDAQEELRDLFRYMTPGGAG
jgi:DNA-directed RNA polymerase specialized sigma24 family protein